MNKVVLSVIAAVYGFIFVSSAAADTLPFHACVYYHLCPSDGQDPLINVVPLPDEVFEISDEEKKACKTAAAEACSDVSGFIAAFQCRQKEYKKCITDTRGRNAIAYCESLFPNENSLSQCTITYAVPAGTPIPQP